MIGYTRKLSAAEELEQLRPQVYDAELRALQHKALRLVLDCTGVMNEKQLAAIAEIKLRYKAVQEFYGPECKPSRLSSTCRRSPSVLRTEKQKGWR